MQLINKLDPEAEARGEYASFDKDDEMLLSNVTRELGMALQKRNMYQESLNSTSPSTQMEQYFTDSLTGMLVLFNDVFIRNVYLVCIIIQTPLLS